MSSKVPTLLFVLVPTLLDVWLVPGSRRVLIPALLCVQCFQLAYAFRPYGAI